MSSDWDFWYLALTFQIITENHSLHSPSPSKNVDVVQPYGGKKKKVNK